MEYFPSISSFISSAATAIGMRPYRVYGNGVTTNDTHNFPSLSGNDPMSMTDAVAAAPTDALVPRRGSKKSRLLSIVSHP